MRQFESQQDGPGWFNNQLHQLFLKSSIHYKFNPLRYLFFSVFPVGLTVLNPINYGLSKKSHYHNYQDPLGKLFFFGDFLTDSNIMGWISLMIHHVFLGPKMFSRWWQLKDFFFNPYLGKMNPFWLAYFSKGLVQPPTSFGSLFAPRSNIRKNLLWPDAHPTTKVPHFSWGSLFAGLSFSVCGGMPFANLVAKYDHIEKSAGKFFRCWDPMPLLW